MPALKVRRESPAEARQSHEFRFVCESEFRDGDVGKLIIAKIRNENVVRLYSAAAKGVSILPRPEGGDGYVLASLRAEAPRISRSAGRHAGIPHQGTVLGGASYAVIGKTLFVNDESLEFGSANRECIAMCLKGKGLSLVMGPDVNGVPWHDYLDMREK